MASVEGDDQVRVEPVCEDHDRCVDGPEREVAVAIDEVGDDRPVIGVRGFDVEAAQAPDERRLAARAQASCGKPGDLGDDERGDDQVQVTPTQDLGTGRVIRIPPIDRGEKRARVNDRG